MEKTPEEYVTKMVEIFQEVKRVLRDNGTLWLNMGDSYASSGNRNNGNSGYDDGRTNRTLRLGGSPVPGLKPKDLCGIPWRVAFALQADGWYLRQDIIWSKPNPMPESVTDRCTKAHEYIFLMTKKAKYYYDNEAIKEPQEEYMVERIKREAKKGMTGQIRNKTAELRKDGGLTRTQKGAWAHLEGRNKRDVWTIPTYSFTGWQQTCRLAREAPDGPCDGKMHIISPSCPCHAGLFDLVAILLGGANEVCDLLRIARKHGCLVQEPISDSCPSDLLHAYCFGGNNLDYLDLNSSFAATEHNSQIHKKALFLLTNPACTPSSQKTAHILYRLKKYVLSEQVQNIYENNIWPDEMDAHLLGQMLYHNTDKFSFHKSPNCICQLYYKITKKSTHFATFPPKLVEPCIKAGSRLDDTILDPFAGSGTTGMVANQLQRNFIGIELNPSYVELARKRIAEDQPLFSMETT